MPQFRPLLSNSNPSPIAWACAGFSALLLLGTCAAIEFGGAAVGQALAVREFVDGLSVSKANQAKQDIAEFLHTRLTPLGIFLQHSGRWLRGESADDSSKSADETVALAQWLRDMLVQVQNRDFSSARSTLDIISRYNRVTLLNALGANQSAAERLIRLQEMTRRADELRQLIPTVERELSDSRAAMSGSRAELEGIAQDMSELFDLDYAEPPELGNPYPVYSAGILSELPIMPDISDDIRDSAQLSAVVKSAGGEIHISGSNLAEALTLRLSELRSTAQRASSEMNTRIAEHDRLKSTLDSARDEYTTLGKRLHLELIRILSRVTEPKLAGVTNRIRQWIGQN